jgi:hypothetical protein
VGVLQRKRRRSGYTSGPRRHWVKVKCPDWKRINAERHKLFEGSRKPELPEEDAREEAPGAYRARGPLFSIFFQNGLILGSCSCFQTITKMMAMTK